MSRPRRWPPPVHNFRGRARVRINGKDYYLGAYGSKDAEREYARLLSIEAAGGAVSGTDLVVSQVVNLFLRHAEQHYPPASGQLVRFEQALRVVVSECGRLPAHDFRVPQLEAVRRRMVAAAWCRNHVNRQIVRVRTAFRWAEQEALVPEGRWSHLRTLKALGPKAPNVKHTQPRRPCTREELTAVQAHAPAPVASMLEVQWLCGARSCEVRQMRPCDIDRTGDVWLYRPQHHKTEHLGQQRVIALGPEAQRVLWPWLLAHLTAGEDELPVFRVLANRRKLDGSAPLGREPYTTHGFCQAVRRAARKAGVKLEPYQARHAFKQRIASLFGLEHARQALGQKSIASTGHYASQQDIEAAARVARRAG